MPVLLDLLGTPYCEGSQLFVVTRCADQLAPPSLKLGPRSRIKHVALLTGQARLPDGWAPLPQLVVAGQR
jgi:hypothetical protein